MKHLLCALFVLFSFGIGCAQKLKAKNQKYIVGSWKISKVDSKEASGSDAEMILAFKKDGTLDAISGNDIKTESGKWKMGEDGTSVSVILEGDELPLKIVSLDKNTMKLDREGSIAEFTKVGAAPKQAKPAKVKLKGPAKDIVGTWQASIGGENNAGLPKQLVQFNADGTAWTQNESNIATWRVSDDGKQLIVVSKNEEKSDFSMSADKKTLTINNKRMVVTLIRVKEKLSKPEPQKEEPWTEPSYPAKKPESHVTEPMPDGITDVKESELIGTWKVISIDSDILEDRTLVFNIRADKSFEITDNGSVERSGKWELKNNRLSIKDASENANNDFSVGKNNEGQLLMKDHYGTFLLKKQ